jgi:hypothetical protein
VSDFVGTAPLTVKFTDMSSGSITSRTWDVDGNGTIDSTITPFIYTYLLPGAYNATLTVTGAGGSSSASEMITVLPGSAPPPSGTATGSTKARVVIDWDNNGNWVEANDDVTSDVISLTWSLGFRKAGQAVADESECTIELRNDDKRYSPENSASPLFGKMLPQRRICVCWERTGMLPGEGQPAADGSNHMWNGWIESIQVAPAENGTLRTQIRGVGAKYLLEQYEIDFPLMENVAADAVIAYALSRVQLPPAAGKTWAVGVPGYSELGVTTRLGGRVGMDLQTGLQLFPFVGDNWDDGVTAYDAIYSAAHSDRGKFFFDRRGRAIYWNRRYLQTITTDAATFDDKQMNLEYSYGADVVNVVEVTITPRKASSIATDVLYQVDSPIKLKPGETRTITCAFRGENGEKISGKNILIPAGADWAADPSIVRTAFDITATSVKVTLTNTSLHEEAEVRTMTIRGRKLTAFDRQTVSQMDGRSALFYGRKQMALTLDLIGDLDFAEQVAKHELRMRKDPRGLVSSITIMNRDLTYSEQIRMLTIGSRIRIKESQTGQQETYFIIGEEHSQREGLKVHEARYFVERAALRDSWLLGVPGRSELGLTTKVGW